ncbi:ferredoxin [Mycobacterium sp. CBMA 234]|uniref:ferredoxin n=1 Tax=Mycolicibacterium sp. CBMA 234 TaxID=1918495 RepID=UPI0012DC9BD0|nr:ferredoxin [Mycolicibacterium sp. CBMA 234]MUL65600.1 ferredoxin [Mycolicibacterium sp. CBMA 234]
MSVRPDVRLADMPMVPVACRACGAEVLARKGSWQQTSVQWTKQSAGMCEERRLSECLPGRIFLACGQLKESIAAAVVAGVVHVVQSESG